MTDLSILIPARNEMFLKQTVKDIVKHSEADTEVIAVLDGQWADPPIVDHPKVNLIYVPEAIGQRAATNLACVTSRSEFVMKCDAHCSFDQGFDRKLIEDFQDDWTVVVPKMYNLHAFDWVCPDGHRRYQGPSGPCEECGKETHREMVWKARKRRLTWWWSFDKNLKFQYEKNGKPKRGNDPIEVMSLIGACWMIRRKDFWRLEICDEGHGSWGQMGTEIACKAWLSGGKLICNRRTWFAHMFRTQGKDFGFPYRLTGKDVQKARRYSKKLWIDNNWPLAVHDLDWLIKKFNPSGWEG
jgi:glycosyltransferase involved in cell wall biosynthesis